MKFGKVDSEMGEPKAATIKSEMVDESPSRRTEASPKLVVQSKWESHMNSDLHNLAVECENHLYFGHWELFRGLAMTLIHEECEPYTKNYILGLLKSFFDNPHDYCKGSTTIKNPQQLYWLCAQFYSELCDSKEEAEKLKADANFRLLLSELNGDQVRDVLAEIYRLYITYSDSSSSLNEPVLSTECQIYLTKLLSGNTEMGCTILETLFRMEQLESGHHRLALLSCLHESFDRCLTRLDLDSGSNFHSEGVPNGLSDAKSAVYRLLLLGGALTFPRSKLSDVDGEVDCGCVKDPPIADCPHLSPLVVLEEQNRRLVARLLEVCERGILDKNIVFSLCLSHGADLYFVRALCHLEDQTRSRVEVDNDITASAANLLHLVRDRSSQLDVRQIFLHTVINGTHFLERIVTSCVELIGSGDSLLAHLTLQDPLLGRLKPLILLITWTQVSSVSGILRFLGSYDQLMTSNEPDRGLFDPTLEAACDELARKARLVLRTLSNNLRGRAKQSRAQYQNVLDLLPGLPGMSPLYVLSRCVPFGSIPRDQAFESLKLCAPSGGGGEVKSRWDKECRLRLVRDEAVLLGYYVLCDFARMVEDGITIDHLMEESRRQDRIALLGAAPPSDDWRLFYQENVLRRLDAVRVDVAKILPLDYRIEILEDAFALLFATHRHVKEGSVDLGGEGSNSSDDGHEGADDYAGQTLDNRGATFQHLEFDNVTSMLARPSHLVKYHNEPIEDKTDSNLLFSDKSENEFQFCAHSDENSDNVHYQDSDSMPKSSAKTKFGHRLHHARGAKDDKERSELLLAEWEELDVFNSDSGRRESKGSGGIKKSRSPMRRYGVTTQSETTHYQPHAHSSECNSSARSTSSGGRGLSRIGFVANTLVVRDLLECVRRCAEDAVSLDLATAKRKEVDGGRSVQRRISRLCQYVSEAQWRFQLVADETTPKGYGEIPMRPLQHFPCATTDWFWNFYVDHVESDEESEGMVATVSKVARKVSLASQNAVRKMGDMRGIINRMLASHDSLLNMCLHQIQFVKAQQVVKMFGMENTAKASEIEFAIAYEKTLRLMLKPGTSVTSPMTGPRSVRSSLALSPALDRSPWESIMNAAQSGADAATATDSLIIDELLASHNVPAISEWDEVAAKVGDVEGQISLQPTIGLPERMDWRSMVKADLAVIGCGRPDVTRSVLESCRGAWRCSSDNVGLRSSTTNTKPGHGAWRGRLKRQKSVSAAKGIIGFLDNMTLLASALSEMGTTESGSHWSPSLPAMSMRGLLLQATWPLSCRQFKVTTNTWKRLGCTLEQFRSFLAKEEIALAAATPSRSACTSLSSSPLAATSGSPRQREITSRERHPMHAVYQKLMRMVAVARLLLSEEEISDGMYDGNVTATDRSGNTTTDKVPAYMLTLFEYAKNVHSFLPQFQFELSLVSGSYFSVFRQAPTTILKQLLFDTSVTPQELENFAKHLNLNLLQMVVQHSSPYVAAIGNWTAQQLADYSGSLETSKRHSNSSGSAGSFKVEEGVPGAVRPNRLSVASLGSCELEIVVLSPVLLEYVRGRCWLAALVMQELGCAGKVKDRSSDLSSSTGGGSDDVDQHNLIFHPTLHRFLQHRRSGMHQQCTQHTASFPFRPTMPATHVNASLDKYMHKADWIGLVEYVDGWECQRIGQLASVAAHRRDDALAKLAESMAVPTNTATPPWIYVLRILDGRRRAELVLKCHGSWNDEGAVASLSACAYDHSLEIEWRSRAQSRLAQVRLYCDIVAAVVSGKVGWLNSLTMPVPLRWQDVAHLSTTNPMALLHHLAGSGRHGDIVRWSEVHPVADELQPICSENAVLFLLETSDAEPSTVQRVLEDTTDAEQRFSICHKVLDLLCARPERAALLLFVVESSNLLGMDLESVRLFLRKKIGLKILLCLAEDERVDYVQLVAHPHLMIEQLFMHFKIETLQRVYHSVRDDLRAFVRDECLSYDALDHLAEVYASKAIDFRIGQASSTGGQLEASAQVSIDQPAESLFVKFVCPATVPTKQQWVPDADATHCAVCQQERFTMFNRRHHCRRCGRVVCATCSQGKGLVLGYGDVAVRVCDECHAAADNPSRSLLDGSESGDPPVPETLEQRLESHFSQNDRAERRRQLKRRHQSFRQTKCLLTLDETHNRTVREEFSYDHAPNISLCLSILDLHWDQRKSADYLLHLAETLFAFLQPVAPGVANAEVDYTLVISLLRTVFLSSRVKFSTLTGNDRDAAAAYCDLCLSLADLLQILVNANCKHLIPVGDYTNTKAVSQLLLKLRDHLIREERWNLALEVSTKGGLNVSGVWMAWGMTSLKVGAYAMARQKFSRCLQTPVDKKKPAPSNTLLGQIIQRLERMQPSVGAVVNTDTVTLFRQRLDAIKTGTLQVANEPITAGVRRLTSEMNAECLHYVRTYGTHETALSFYVRHDEYEEAMRYFIAEKCMPAAFVDHVALPSMRRGCWHRVQEAALVVDKPLDSLAGPFGALCRHLERTSWLHSLYGVQVFTRDHVRSAFTCIQFYQRDARDYSDLYDRLPHLVNARHHLQTYKQQFAQGSPSFAKKLVKHATAAETDRYLRSIALQDEATKFLQGKSAFWHDTFTTGSTSSDAGSVASFSMSRDLSIDKDAGSVPTMFQDSTSRAHVVALVLTMGISVAEGFNLAMRIIREYRLRAPNVFSLVAKRLLQEQRTPQVVQLIGLMKEVAGQTDEECDKALLRTIQQATAKGCDNKELESLIKLLIDENIKIEAQIHCGKLKSAYLLAVKRDSSVFIQRILSEADRTGQTTVKAICEKWMNRKKNN